MKCSHRVVASFEGIKELARSCTPGTHVHAPATMAQTFLGKMSHLEEEALAECIQRNVVLQQVGTEIITERDLDLVEFGAGSAMMSSKAEEKNLRGQKMDILYGESDDFSTTIGRAKARSLTLRIRPGGCAWIGLPSSWWVWMSR